MDWLEDDLRSLRRAGVDVVVSALTPTEAEELGLLDEGRHCESNGLEFFSFPIEDRAVPPSFRQFEDLLNVLAECLSNGKAVAVHCRAGVGRSAMIVASALIRNGLSVESAFAAIEEARGCSVPDTPQQKNWVERHSPRMARPEK